ncbi:MAG: glycosyl transferase family 2 [Clostridia bacterium]|nr:glycosyl transferase family 2 [Clostridia bacterium]
MNKYKICVYAICKNESKFVDRWFDSMKEADLIVVADTGSTDDTIEKLVQKGVIVKKIDVNPFRFDIARNISMDMIPEDVDICVCTDIDEFFEPGWREKLERSWRENTTRVKYSYTWNFNPDGSPGLTFIYEKIHARDGFRWIHPVHEILEYNGVKPDNYAWCTDIQLNHMADPSKSRKFYLSLLELSVNEDPSDDRNMHYLGREYMFNEMWDKCIETLTKHLTLEKATWKDERSASMRYIARAYTAKKDFIEAKSWLFRAIAEAPYLREPYVELAKLSNSQNDFACAYHMVDSCIKIKEKAVTYMNEASSWDYTIYDLGAICSYYLGLYEKALEYAQIAIDMNPNDERLKSNYELIKSKIYK